MGGSPQCGGRCWWTQEGLGCQARKLQHSPVGAGETPRSLKVEGLRCSESCCGVKLGGWRQMLSEQQGDSGGEMGQRWLWQEDGGHKTGVDTGRVLKV